MADEQSSEQKPDVDKINLKVVTQDGNEIFFTCKMTTPLQKVGARFLAANRSITVPLADFIYLPRLPRGRRESFVFPVKASPTRLCRVGPVAKHSLSAYLSPCRVTSLHNMQLMTAFSNRQGVAMNSVRFLFDGNRINGSQTPKDLEMEDGGAHEASHLFSTAPNATVLRLTRLPSAPRRAQTASMSWSSSKVALLPSCGHPHCCLRESCREAWAVLTDRKCSDCAVCM